MNGEQMAAAMEGGMARFLNRTTPEDGVDLFTPAAAMMAKESLAEMMAKESDGDEGEAGEWELRQREAGVRAFVRFLMAGGAHPLRMLRRMITTAVAMRVEPFVSMTYQELGMLTGETKAAFSHQMKVLAGVVASAGGGRCMKLPGEKTASSTPHYREAQIGNTNRADGEKRKAVRKVRSAFKADAAKAAGKIS
jgi:hypothetical protein